MAAALSNLASPPSALISIRSPSSPSSSNSNNSRVSHCRARWDRSPPSKRGLCAHSPLLPHWPRRRLASPDLSSILSLSSLLRTNRSCSLFCLEALQHLHRMHLSRRLRFVPDRHPTQLQPHHPVALSARNRFKADPRWLTALVSQQLLWAPQASRVCHAAPSPPKSSTRTLHHCGGKRDLILL
jgi:hypothetical protein